MIGNLLMNVDFSVLPPDVADTAEKLANPALTILKALRASNIAIVIFLVAALVWLGRCYIVSYYKHYDKEDVKFDKDFVEEIANVVTSEEKEEERETLVGITDGSEKDSIDALEYNPSLRIEGESALDFEPRKKTESDNAEGSKGFVLLSPQGSAVTQSGENTDTESKGFVMVTPHGKALPSQMNWDEIHKKMEEEKALKGKNLSPDRFKSIERKSEMGVCEYDENGMMIFDSANVNYNRVGYDDAIRVSKMLAENADVINRELEKGIEHGNKQNQGALHFVKFRGWYWLVFGGILVAMLAPWYMMIAFVVWAFLAVPIGAGLAKIYRWMKNRF